MKRIYRVIFALFCAIFCISFSVTRTDAIETNITASQADTNADSEYFEQRLYQTIEEGIRNKTGLIDDNYIDLSEFNMPPRVGTGSGKKADDDVLWHTFQRVFFDHPEFFYVSEGFRYHNSDDQLMGITPIYYEFAKDPDVVEKYQRKLDKAVNTALAQIEGIDEPVEQLLALYDYLAILNVYNREISIGNEAMAPSYVRSAYGALVKGDSVCKGMAMAFKLLIDRLDDQSLSCIIVPGNDNNHVWNMVRINDEWYHMDVNTAISAVPTLRGWHKHSGFLMSDEESRAQGNYGWNEAVIWELPECSDKQYDSGWSVKETNFPMYRKDGVYYYIKSTGYRQYALYYGGLSEKGTMITTIPLLTREFIGNTGEFWRTCSGIVWLNDCLYYVNTKKELVCYNINSGDSTTLISIPFAPQSSQENPPSYGDEYDGIGLWYDEKNSSIVAVSRTRQTELLRYSVETSEKTQENTLLMFQKIIINQRMQIIANLF